jgi:hypothetical protein
MAEVGKCLLFYLKYPAEMERLFRAEDPKLEGLPDAEKTLEKIRRVGNAADREAADFVESCAPGIEQRLRTITSVRRIRSNPEKTWGVKFRVGSTVAASKSFEIGMHIHDGRASLVAWLWCPGGRRLEDELIGVLGRGSRASTVLGWSYGGVVLAEVKIPIPETFEEPGSRDSLVAKVQQEFAAITATEVEAIAAIANRRGEQ